MSNPTIDEKPEAPAPEPVAIRRNMQIMADGNAIEYSQRPREIDAPNMIEIGEADDYTGWMYRVGTWIEPPPAPVTPQPMPSLTRPSFTLRCSQSVSPRSRSKPSLPPPTRSGRQDRYSLALGG